MRSDSSRRTAVAELLFRVDVAWTAILIEEGEPARVVDEKQLMQIHVIK